MVKMASPHSLLPPVGSSSLHRCVINHSSVVPKFPQLPTFNLCQSCMPASWHRPPEFYLRNLCVLKPHTSETLSVGTHSDLWDCLTTLRLLSRCPRKHSRDHAVTAAAQSLGKAQHNVDARFCCPQPVSFFL